MQAAKKNEASIAVHLTGCFLHINLHIDESPTFDSVLPLVVTQLLHSKP